MRINDIGVLPHGDAVGCRGVSTLLGLPAKVVVRGLKITFIVLQALWMVAILPGHVRGFLVIGGDSCPDCQPATKSVEPACCAAKSHPLKPGETPSPERQSRCAVCYQSHGYSLPPVFDFDLAPTGLCELRRLIEPSKLHQLLCDPVYFANGPPVV